MEYVEFIQSYKRRTNVMNRCRIPDCCERYKIDTGIYDPKSKWILSRSIKPKDLCVHTHKKLLLCFLEKKRQGSLLNGVEEIDRSLQYVKNRIKGNNLK